MPANDHLLTLQKDEAAILYDALVQARLNKVMEFDETHNMKVLEEIMQLRMLIDRVFRLMVTGTASPSMN